MLRLGDGPNIEHFAEHPSAFAPFVLTLIE
jgi:hypothetical protein